MNKNLSNELVIKSLYSLKEYNLCLNEIIKNIDQIKDENSYIIGLCCSLLYPSMPSNMIADLKSKIKREGYSNLIYAYNFLYEGNKYTGDMRVLNKFALMLIDSADGACIKYIRIILENNKDINYIEIAEKACHKGLFYLSEEIINLYCKDNRYEYDTLIILIHVYLNTGKLTECEKYISLARVINDSIELGKLECVCKIKECKSILLNFKEFDSLNRVYNYLDESEKILSK